MKRKNNSPTLMSKLIKYFLIIIVMMFLLIAYSTYGFRSFYNDFRIMLNQLVETYSIYTEMDDLHQQIVNYSKINSEEYVTKYEGLLSDVNRRLQLLDTKNLSKDARYRLLCVRKILVNFDKKSKSIITDYKTGVGIIYINSSLGELSNLKTYVQDETTGLLFENLISIQSYYSGFNKKLSLRQNVLYTLTGIITLICILFAVRFSRQISIPIHELVVRAAKVSKGDLNIDRVEIRTNYELNTLVDSFNYMIIQIKRLISSIEEKAQVENRLKEQEIKNLEISNLLNESEIKFLQSQINPHFLFNTINTIIALTDVGNTGQIREMLESMARILRYNLKKLDMLVTLGDEYRVVKDFIYIQKMRFGDRIKYEMKIDKSVLSYKVPSMILQPFVENAIRHGLEPKVGKGTLHIAIIDMTDHVQILIRDNGIGMTPEKISMILNNDHEENDESKIGIGIKNVIRRLELRYGRKAVEIVSILGEGTEIRMKLDKCS